jgi:transcriptional regulator with XRE-family HTH domain
MRTPGSSGAVAWNPEKARQALRQFMLNRKLKIDPWAKRAGVSSGTIRNFLDGRSSSLTHKTLEKLAGAESVPIAVLIDPEYQESANEAAKLTEDEALLFDCIVAFEEVVEELGMRLSVEKKARRIIEMYRLQRERHAAGRPALSGAEIVRMVRKAG